MSITGIVENDTVKLPMHVPDGTRVEIVLQMEAATQGAPTAETENFKAWLVATTGIAKGRVTTDERMRETRGED